MVLWVKREGSCLDCNSLWDDSVPFGGCAVKELRIVEVPCIVVDHLDDASEQQLRSLVLLTMLGGDVRPRRLGWACARTASDVDDPDSNGEEEDDHEQA